MAVKYAGHTAEAAHGSGAGRADAGAGVDNEGGDGLGLSHGVVIP